MNFGNNSSATVENNSENQGMMTGKNYGCMIQNNYGLSYKDVIDICHAIMHDDLIYN